jgi:hypothetical protein
MRKTAGKWRERFTFRDGCSDSHRLFGSFENRGLANEHWRQTDNREAHRRI